MDYETTLARARRVGAGVTDDAGAMALFCDSSLRLLAGAVSPALVWEGAQRQGMTALELARLTGESPRAVAELMWS